MGFLDKIDDDNDVELEQEHAETIRRSEEAAEIAAVRAGIIDKRVGEFAGLHGEPMQLIKVTSNARFYLVGDIVLAVRLYGNTPKQELSTTEPRKVLWQYTFAIVGIDRTERACEVGRSCLKLLDYAGVRKAINANKDLVFMNEQVLEVLDLNSSTL